ncbi:MAG: hypothetical protein QOI00_1779 [Chloroflexota bacterium]|jgi:hypothetical protein|nr:hypothetical protein [Chloroflexota bacterium]
MARAPRRRTALARLRRTFISAVGAALLALPLAASPVGATVILRDHYSDDYGFSFDDCGFWIDVSGHDQGIAQLRVGKGDLATAFFLHDNYEFLETWTRRDTGDHFTIEGNGLFQETKATPVEGTIFAFTSINAGQPFVVRDSDGNLVGRDRGVIRQVLEFDTLGDDVPGGQFVADVSFSVSGPHPGLDFDPCSMLE